MCGEKEVCNGWMSASNKLKAHDCLFSASVLSVPPVCCTWPVAGVFYSWLGIRVLYAKYIITYYLENMWTSSGASPCCPKEIEPSSELKEHCVSVIVGERKGKENREGFLYKNMPSVWCSKKVTQGYQK